MWCADGADASWPVGGKASVTQWGAKDGTFHRKIVLDPQPGLTAEAMIWYTTALSSPTVEWAGRVSFFSYKKRGERERGKAYRAPAPARAFSPPLTLSSARVPIFFPLLFPRNGTGTSCGTPSTTWNPKIG